MTTSSFDATIAEALEGRRLLDHPFYRKWQLGELSVEDIGSYSGQYRHFECLLPAVLSTVSETIDQAPARELVTRNLDDELSDPAPHLELFDRFAAAVGSSGEVGPSPATTQLVDLYRAGAAAGPVPGLAVIAGYEVQAAEIAATKGESLRRHLGLADDDTRFWDVHAAKEESHAAWTTQALEMLDADDETVRDWANRSAAAWWSFLDERDAATCDTR